MITTPLDLERVSGASGMVHLEHLDRLAGLAPVDVAEAFRGLPGLALLESARPGRRAGWTYLVADPLQVVSTLGPPGDVFAPARAALGRLAGASIGPDPSRPGAVAPPFTGGLVGLLGYDLARSLERLPNRAVDDQALPALRLGLHDWVIAWDRRTGSAWLAGRPADDDRVRLASRLAEVRGRLDRARSLVASSRGRGSDREGSRVEGLRFLSRTSRAGWLEGVQAIRSAIADGELYQANLARRVDAAFDGDPWPLYRRLRTGDPAVFAAFVDLGEADDGASRAVLSASPEPFLGVTAGGFVSTDPIKGTRPRGGDRVRDRALACELLGSAKDHAENVMIVDVLRNDLGRVCVPGSVRVPRLCRLERTATVQHLVSTVTGRLRPGLGPFDLLEAAFPGGSITGAPKIRAMRLIEEVEPLRRGPYTGALAWIGPDGAMGSSIVIRTFVADGRRLTLHVGGGITWRSDPADEWDETVAKARGPLRAIGASVAEEAGHRSGS